MTIMSFYFDWFVFTLGNYITRYILRYWTPLSLGQLTLCLFKETHLVDWVYINWDLIVNELEALAHAPLTPKLVLIQGCRKVWKSGGQLIGIGHNMPIPPCWNRVVWPEKSRGWAIPRNANSLVVFIPQGIGEWQFVVLWDVGNWYLFPAFQVQGNFGEYFVPDLKLIWNFFLLKIFFWNFFQNEKKAIIFMIRNDKIMGK